MESNNVAKTILQQLGANRFVAMTGAKNFMGDDTSLVFSLPRAKDGINRVKVILDANDTYTVRFIKINLRAKTADDICKVVAEDEGIYCDSLQQVFFNRTGLYTRF